MHFAFPRKSGQFFPRAKASASALHGVRLCKIFRPRSLLQKPSRFAVGQWRISQLSIQSDNYPLSLESEKKAWQEIFPSGGCGLGCLLLYASISAATAITCASSQITHHFQLYYYFNSRVNEPPPAAAECFSALALGSRSVYFAGALRSPA
jgi:hypothetical protein